MRKKEVYIYIYVRSYALYAFCMFDIRRYVFHIYSRVPTHIFFTHTCLHAYSKFKYISLYMYVRIRVHHTHTHTHPYTCTQGVGINTRANKKKDMYVRGETHPYRRTWNREEERRILVSGLERTREKRERVSLASEAIGEPL